MNPATSLLFARLPASVKPGRLRVNAAYSIACHNGCENLLSRNFQRTAIGQCPPTVPEPRA